MVDLRCYKITKELFDGPVIEQWVQIFFNSDYEEEYDKDSLYYFTNIEEELESLEEQYKDLQDETLSINIAREMLEKAYEKMKNNVSPIFTEKLSKNISKITNDKYNNIYLNDEKGLIVELENGNYISAERLSIGTIDQLYLSLRLSMLDEISEEKVPIILDEAFAYYDKKRLENILKYLANEFSDRQVIILTCTKREKAVLEENQINFNFIEL